MTWIYATFAFVSILSVSGLIASNIYLILALSKRQMMEKAENLYELTDATKETEIPVRQTVVEVPAFDN